MNQGHPVWDAIKTVLENLDEYCSLRQRQASSKVPILVRERKGIGYLSADTN